VRVTNSDQEFLRLEVRESIKVNRIKFTQNTMAMQKKSPIPCFTIIDPPAYDFAHWTRSFPPTKLLNDMNVKRSNDNAKTGILRKH
jgi:hypothetical protein